MLQWIYSKKNQRRSDKDKTLRQNFNKPRFKFNWLACFRMSEVKAFHSEVCCSMALIRASTFSGSFLWRTVDTIFETHSWKCLRDPVCGTQRNLQRWLKQLNTTNWILKHEYCQEFKRKHFYYESFCIWKS